MTGLERNSDIVFAAAYAPILQVRYGSQLIRSDVDMSKEHQQIPMGM